MNYLYSLTNKKTVLTQEQIHVIFTQISHGKSYIDEHDLKQYMNIIGERLKEELQNTLVHLNTKLRTIRKP